MSDKITPMTPALQSAIERIAEENGFSFRPVGDFDVAEIKGGAVFLPKDRVTSPEVAALAARGVQDPASLTPEEIKSVCASALAQAESVTFQGDLKVGATWPIPLSSKVFQVRDGEPVEFGVALDRIPGVMITNTQELAPLQDGETYEWGFTVSETGMTVALKIVDPQGERRTATPEPSSHALATVKP